jgi:hypothetical protein
VEHWLRVGPILDELRRQELRDFRHEENAAAIDALLDLGARCGPPRTTSGLIEMQRLLRDKQS